MTGGSLFSRAKKAICRGGSSRGGSSRGESSRDTGTPSTLVHPDSQEEIECSRTQQTPRQSFYSEAPAPEEGVWLIDEQGNPIRRRGRTTCADIQNMPPGTRIHIEVNENNIPCNIPESILLGTYLGVVARDPVLAPIAFPDWRNKGMEPFKKKMLAEVEEKAAKNSANAKKQTFPHTMGRVSSVRRQKETTDCNYEKSIECTKMGPGHLKMLCNDGYIYIMQTCNLLAEEGLTPEDENIEANERVFTIVMGPEHSGRVRTQGFGVTPIRYFPQSKNEEGGGSGSNFGQMTSLREEFRSFRDNQMREFGSFRDEMRQFMQQFQMNQPSHGGSEMIYIGNDCYSGQALTWICVFFDAKHPH
ncbi:hypothetical protein IEQ34_007284 [Dendrobium chrysotoxum]|uniref:Uncharacterized protein n=1 Tax=Dendrobium chrysotoxum TaxID=161865 RepID=A0AAV7HA97_DENCH|nr:hypothetical protein IEQ34_007284 [Dendrobium chrysotoxum]